MNLKVLFAGLALAFATSPTYAQEFPKKPINMLVGYAAGGSVDIQARGLADQLAAIFKQPVNIINQPGAGAAIAATQLSKAAADGYTIMFDNTSTLTFTPLVTPVDFKPSDFRIVGSVAVSQPAIVVNSASPIKSFEDILVAAKERGGVTYATQTQADRMIMTALAKKNGVNIQIVPTKGGGEMQGLILGNQVDFAYSGGLHVNFLESKQMRVLASLNSERLVATPDAPTLSEIGLDYGIDNYRVLMVPKDTPDGIVKILESAMVEAAGTQAFKDLTEKQLQFPIEVLPGKELEKRLSAAEENSKKLIAAVK